MTTRNRRRLGIAIAGMINFLNLYWVQALLPTLAADFHAPPASTGLTVTATLLAVSLLAPFAGVISDMLGRKRLIVCATWVLVIPTLLAAGAASLHALVLWRFVQGLLLPFIFTVAVAYIGDEAPGSDGIALAGTYSMGTIFGGFASRFVSGYVTDFLNWRASFLLLAALTVASALAVGLLLPRERNFRAVRGLGITLASFRDHLTNPRLLAICAVGFSVLFSIIAAFTFANFVLSAPPYGLGPAALGSIFAVYLFGMVSTPVATKLALRFGRLPTLALAAAMAVGGLILTLAPSLWAIIGGLAMLAGAVFVEQSLTISYIGVAAQRAKSTAVGLYVTSYYVGGSLGGILPAGIWHWAGWPGCVALSAAVQTLMLAIALVFWRDPPGREPGLP
ncbi:MAG: MFS transporter [Alphaproteobacteria bacterium]|nr:MFS transporter [Alphaproteobacteria bacterium]